MKSISIKEGGRPRGIANVSKLKIDNQDGTQSDWVPEDERIRQSKYVYSNGVYVPADDSIYGYRKLTVNVPGGAPGYTVPTLPDGSFDPSGIPQLMPVEPGGIGCEIQGIDPISLDIISMGIDPITAGPIQIDKFSPETRIQAPEGMNYVLKGKTDVLLGDSLEISDKMKGLYTPDIIYTGIDIDIEWIIFSSSVMTVTKKSSVIKGISKESFINTVENYIRTDEIGKYYDTPSALPEVGVVTIPDTPTESYKISYSSKPMIYFRIKIRTLPMKALYPIRHKWTWKYKPEDTTVRLINNLPWNVYGDYNWDLNEHHTFKLELDNGSILLVTDQSKYITGFEFENTINAVVTHTGSEGTHTSEHGLFIRISNIPINKVYYNGKIQDAPDYAMTLGGHNVDFSSF